MAFVVVVTPQKVIAGATSKPDEVSSEIWWHVYTFNDRAKWLAEHKAKEKAVQDLGSGAPGSTGLVPALATPRPDELFPLGDCPPMMVDPSH
eukprot:14497700-Heterocapsa_arctica.AAC.1